MGKSNQKTVTITKETCSESLYAAIALTTMEAAMANLGGDGFKLWCYFAKNKEGHKDNLSSNYCKNLMNLTTYAYNEAIKELIEKRYLVDENTDPEEAINRWGFYELPKEEDKRVPQPQECTTTKKLQAPGPIKDNATQAGIYCIKVNDKITYVGKSINIPQRFSQHRRAIETNYPEAKYRLLKTVKDLGYKIDFEILYFSNAHGKENIQEDIGKAEGIYINKYKPILNTIIPDEKDWHKSTHNSKVKNLTVEEFLEAIK